MFCPKCGTKNPDDGKFCRKCGTDLGGVSKALKNEGDSALTSFGDSMDPTGFSSSGRHGNRNKTPEDVWGLGIRNTIFGFGFLIISMVLFFTNVAGGQSWWWAMLFPGFSLIAGGIGSIAKANRLEKRLAENRKLKAQIDSPRENVSLPPKQTDYIPADSSSYNTGDLVPSSVVENTTRHLKTDSEGETMTLPSDKV